MPDLRRECDGTYRFPSCAPAGLAVGFGREGLPAASLRLHPEEVVSRPLPLTWFPRSAPSSKHPRLPRHRLGWIRRCSRAVGAPSVPLGPATQRDAGIILMTAYSVKPEHHLPAGITRMP